MTTDANFVVKKGLNVQDGDISIKGSNKELRFYEGSNYVGFEAPALSADKIWVLPAADGSTGQALKTDGSGNLGWVTAGDATLAGTQTFTGAKTFSSDVNLNDAGLTINEQYGRINFKKDATNNTVNNYAIFFYDTSDNIKGAINFNNSGSRLGFNANGDYQLYLQDGVFYPVVDNDVDLGTSSLKFKDSFFGLVDAENFKINGGQGSDGEVLTSTGSGVAWEAVSGGIASLAADTTPQLGGDLDVNGNEIVSTSNANIGITPNGTGRVVIGSTTSQHDALSKLTIKGSDAGMLIEKHDDGSSGGPTLALYRYSASVADSDLIGQVNFRGEGSTGNPSTYISLRTQIEDTTEGTKDGKLIVRGLKANSQTDFMSVGSTGVEFEGGAKVGVVTDVTIGSGTSGTTTGFRLGANQEAGMVAGEVSSQSTANDGYIELMNMDLDGLTTSSGLQTIELTVQIEDETNEEVESFKALVQASEKTVLGTTARAVNFTEWAILYDGAARIGTLAADYDSSDDTIRIRYQNKQGSTATLTATFYAITMQNNT